MENARHQEENHDFINTRSVHSCSRLTHLLSMHLHSGESETNWRISLQENRRTLKCRGRIRIPRARSNSGYTLIFRGTRIAGFNNDAVS
jgi:hypothetical protein